MPEGDLTARQLELIATLAALEPPPWFMGGYAEEQSGELSSISGSSTERTEATGCACTG